MGGPVVLRAFAWAMVMDGTYPTLTLHGSNDPAFFVDQTVTIPQDARVAAGAYSRNEHQLTHGTLLCQLCVNSPGSRWTAEEVAAGTADVYLTRLFSEPRYTRMFTTGRLGDVYNGWDAGHVFPTLVPAVEAFRYFALTVSVGILTGSVARTVEIHPGDPPRDPLLPRVPAIGRGSSAVEQR